MQQRLRYVQCWKVQSIVGRIAATTAVGNSAVTGALVAGRADHVKEGEGPRRHRDNPRWRP